MNSRPFLGRGFFIFKNVIKEELRVFDIKLLRSNFQEVKEKLKYRGEDISELDRFEELDSKRRELIVESEQLKNKRNEVSAQIAQLKREKKDAEPFILEMREVGEKIKKLDEELAVIEEQLNHLLLSLPNIPHESVPIGESEDDNVEIRKWGELPNFTFEPKPHWDLGVELGIIDFERAAKVSGSRFAFYKGLGARLERALINFMLDLHIEKHGYTEMLPPYLVNRTSLTGTGQLPKFEEDAFLVEKEDYF